MKKLGALVLAWPLLAVPAWNTIARAQPPDECLLGQQQIERDFPLPQVAHAVGNKQLKILVVGAGSSSLPGPNGAKKAFPARLQDVLSEKLPGVAVKVATDVKARRTAGEMVKTLDAALAENKPALVVWQTGTVDAMLSIDHDQFSAMLDRGINIARSAGADVVLVNAQYSPQTESMIALGTYAEIMRWVAVQQEAPLFDRFSIMKLWSDFGAFDLQSATNKLDIAERVHNCVGRLLADLIVETVKPNEPPIEGGR